MSERQRPNHRHSAPRAALFPLGRPSAREAERMAGAFTHRTPQRRRGCRNLDEVTTGTRDSPPPGGALLKPRMRGWLHFWSFAVSIAAGATPIAVSAAPVGGGGAPPPPGDS